MKRPEEMSDSELDAYLASGAVQKKPEEMTDDELDAFLADGGTSQQELSQSSVLNEAADIPWHQRLAVKNFGGSVDDQISFLKKHNSPDLEIRNHLGEIVAKKKGDTSWKKLDPDGVTGLSEAAQDAGDVLYDLGSGAASNAATAVSGLLGSVAGPVGTVGGAMAGGAASSAALEGIRQAIGKSLGTASEFSGDDIKLSAGLGALGPLLFGGNATKKQIAAHVAKPGVAGKVLERLGMGYIPPNTPASKAKRSAAAGIIEDSQRGLLGRSTGLLGGMITGWAPKETIKSATDHVSPKIIKDLIENGLELNPTKKHTHQEIAIALTNQDKIGGFGDMASNTIYTVIENEKRKIGDQIAEGLQKEGKKFDVSQLKAGLEATIEAASKSEIPAIRDQAEAARKIAKKYFTPIETRTFHDDVGDVIADASKHSGEVFDEMGEELERRTLRAGIKTELNAVDAMKLNNALSDYLDYTKNPLASEKLSPAERQLRGVVSEAKDTLQDNIYNAMKESGSPNMRGLYRENREFFRNIYPHFSTPEKSVQTLNNLNSPSKKVLRERIKAFDSTHKNANIGDLADLASVTKYFGDPSLEAVSSGGATSTGKILRTGDVMGSAGYMGGLATGMPGMGQLGAQIGKSTGAVVSSPMVGGEYLKAVTFGKRAAEKTGVTDLVRSLSKTRDKLPLHLQPTFTVPGAYQSAWRLMGDNK